MGSRSGGGGREWLDCMAKCLTAGLRLRSVCGAVESKILLQKMIVNHGFGDSFNV